MAKLYKMCFQPEIIAPKDSMKPNYDIRSDFWSLSITLIELATKKYPYGNYKTEFEVRTFIFIYIT